jgi:hypothetical protein
VVEVKRDPLPGPVLAVKKHPKRKQGRDRKRGHNFSAVLLSNMSPLATNLARRLSEIYVAIIPCGKIPFALLFLKAPLWWYL